MTITYYDQFLTNVANGSIDLVNDEFRVLLVNGYTFSALHDEKADVVASEIPAGSAYSTGGIQLTGKTFGFDDANDRSKWDADDVSITASGGSLGPVTGAIIYSVTSTDDKLVAYLDFGGAETASDGEELRLTFGADGLFVINH
jgi:hypothetical protein